MHHFSYMSFSYTCTNRLQKAILAYLLENDRRIIDDADIARFRKEILGGIAFLNRAHSKCNPVNAHWASDEKDSKLYMGSGVICNFHIYKTKN